MESTFNKDHLQVASHEVPIEKKKFKRMKLYLFLLLFGFFVFISHTSAEENSEQIYINFY